jgi:hypothetical protein
MTSSHSTALAGTPGGGSVVVLGGTTGMPRTDVEAWARAWSRAPVVVEVWLVSTIHASIDQSIDTWETGV